ncbi:prepilin-type N-terminal cleavage/methylation domain-containing protein [bacterium]|nr:prepilin-type N-terminal cleavage/methylation domain-containing protein [bacterium]
MKWPEHRALTLVELLVSIAILGIISATSVALLHVCLNTQAYGIQHSETHRKGMLVLDRLTRQIRTSSAVLIPNSHAPQRNLLALSGFVNDDQDYYFADPLFPRIDEDCHDRMTTDGKSGIPDVDDDGDGSVDENEKEDDDEDADNTFDGTNPWYSPGYEGDENEDTLDGQDNDGDGNIDEDLKEDMNDDGKPGIRGMDDDGDGFVDEGDSHDDDEDGVKNEDHLNPVIYEFDSQQKLLWQKHPLTGTSQVLLSDVKNFETRFDGPLRILVILSIEAPDGTISTFSEWACPRNVLQKSGKRVR